MKKPKPMPKMTCPICRQSLTEQWMIRERLSKLGYLHNDKTYYCSECGHIVTRGLELQKTKPPYWFGKKGIWTQYKKQYWVYIVNTLNDMWKCQFCGHRPVKIHKIHAHLFAQATSPTHLKKHRDREFMTLSLQGEIETKEPLLVQVKCPNCYVVRYLII